MKIIIVGCGKVGKTLATQLLAEQHEVTVIDTDAEVIQEINNSLDVIGYVGNGTSYQILQNADIEHADLLISITGSDEVNLLCCLIAKKAADVMTIARVRNPIYNSEIAFLKESLGLAMIINPDFASANEISRILRRRSVLDINSFAKGRIEILKIKLEEDSPLCDTPLYELPAKLRCEVLICAVERGSEVIIPSGNFKPEAGDFIYFLATPQSTSAFLKRSGYRTNGVKSCIIVGGSKGAYYLANQLIGHGIAVKIIEKNLARCEELAVLLPKADIIHGDGTDEALLREEGIDSTDSFISLTDVDEENIMMSLFVGEHTNAKVITKINRIGFDSIIRNLDLGTVVYPKNATSESIIQYVRALENSKGSNVETLYRVIEGKVEALEFAIREESELTSCTLGELGAAGKLIDNTLVCCIIHGGKTLIPKGSDKISLGDTVIVVTAQLGLTDVKDILK